MKIVISSRYHIDSYFGGSETYSDSIAANLANHHQVFYITQSPASKKKHNYTILNYSARALGKHSLFSQNLVRIIKKIKPDIFHAIGTGLHHHLAQKYISNSLSKPTIFSFLAPSTPESLIAKKISDFEVNYIHNHYSAVSHLTSSDKNIPPLNPILPTNIQMQKTVTKTEALSQLKLKLKKSYILQVSKLDHHHYYKGVEVAINCLKILPQKFHLLLVGNGDQRHYYQKLALSIGVSNQITFLQNVDTEELSLLYQACDVLIQPSTTVSEGFGIVLLEALYFGTPVVTTSPAGLSKDLTHAKIGTVIPAKSITSLAQAIIDSKTPTAIQQNKFNSFALKYNNKRLSTQLNKIYKHAISQS